MQFEEGHLFHIYNRGNNSQRVFFSKDNYLFFLKKIKKYVLPFSDVLAWCLMPTHFHLMVRVNYVMVEVESEQATSSCLLTKPRLFNDSISIMLRSYTRAIHKQEIRSGSLFQNRTKAVCLTHIDGISPTWFQTEYGTQINASNPEKEYPQICFNYIHINPVKNGLVKRITDWELSSARDYAGLRNGKLINKKITKEYGLTLME